MTNDIRAESAKYYDLQKIPFDDVPFYIEHIPSPNANILELGCGTGRVLVTLASHCAYIHGLDISKAMLKTGRIRLYQPMRTKSISYNSAMDTCLMR